MGYEAKITAKHQITLPKEVRERLHTQRGETVEFVLRGEDILVRKLHMPRQDDPFLIFTEWTSAADDEDYADL
jgi:AbrB family looped-hinge helix DNA binding protein